MTRRTDLVVLTVLAVIGAGCQGGGDSASGPTSQSPKKRAFCDGWTAAIGSNDESAFETLFAEPPAEIADAAAILRESEASGSESPEVDAAASEIQNWIELHCPQRAPGDSQRHVAPPIDAPFEGLTFCGTTAYPRSPDDDRYGMVLYGDTASGDPYDGPMLGVLWNPAADGGHGGDGDYVPVTVQGHSGDAAPITVFQQTVRPEVGTVISWVDDDHGFGLYGRRWPLERTDELVAIADRVEAVNGGFQIPDDALPDGYTKVFTGSPSVLSLILAPSPLYSVRYQRDNALLNVDGLQMTEGEFEAFRFLTIGVDHGDAGGRDGLVGNAWDATGPAVVTWREPDGLVVRIVGLSVPLDTALQVARQSRALTDSEYAALVEADDGCEPIRPNVLQAGLSAP